MLLCLKEEPRALIFFEALSENERKVYVDWIYSARQEQTKIERMAEAINWLSRGVRIPVKTAIHDE